MPDKSNASVSVDGTLLKTDRKAAGFTQASFCAECASVSLITVRRAEQGHRIIRPYLARMASVLGRPVERYAVEDELAAATEYVVSLTGEWTGFYIEADRGALPCVVQEDIVLRQNGAYVDGDYCVYAPTEIRTEKLKGGRVINNVLSGVICPSQWLLPSGMASLMQMVSRNNDWLEGFTVWYDSDSDQIETSRMISVRKNSAFYLQYLREARRIVEGDLAIYRMRNLMEKGYGFDDAVAMMQMVDQNGGAKPASAKLRAPTIGMLRIENTGYLDRLNLSYEDLLERLIELDCESVGAHGDFDEIHEGTVEQWAPIFKEHPKCWRLLTSGSHIVGYWHFLALRPEKMAAARRGKLLDSTLSLEDIVPIDMPGSYPVYMVMIVCEPKYRFGHPFKLLLDSVFDATELLAANRIFIDDIVFAAWTPMAERLARRLKFSRIGSLQPVDGYGLGRAVNIFQADFRDVLSSDQLRDFQAVRKAYSVE